MQDYEKKEWMAQLIANTTSQEMVRPLSLLSVNRAYLWTHLHCDEPGADEKVKQALESIEYAEAYIERLWQNSADLFDLTHDGVRFRQESIDLTTLLEDIGSESRYMERAAHIQLECRLPQKRLCATTDTSMAEKIVLNLLADALHRSKPGGKIVMSLKETEGGCQIVVQDNGTPMNDVQIHTLCDGEKEENGQPQWMQLGLELHLCRELCRVAGWLPQVKVTKRSTAVMLCIPKEELIPAGQIQFCSNGEMQQLWKKERKVRIRRTLGCLPELEGYWKE